MKHVAVFGALAVALVMGLPAALAQKASGGIAWMTIEEAMAAQKKQPRKIMIDVYTSWCGPCNMMMANTFTNADVIAYINANYYAVKFDAESQPPVQFRGTTYSNPSYRPGVTGRNGTHEFSRALGVNAYPTLVYLDEKGEIIAPISGYRTPQQLEMHLRFFKEKWTRSTTQTEWDAYQKTFVPTFR